MIETQEDIYVGSIETDRGVREQVRFYDTRGLRDGLELPKHCFSCTDGYVLVYSTDSKESFRRVELLKKEIDKCKDKKEVSAVPTRGAASPLPGAECGSGGSRLSRAALCPHCGSTAAGRRKRLRVLRCRRERRSAPLVAP